MWKSLSSALLILCLSLPSVAGIPVQRLLQLVDYVGVDYREAVRDGVVINPEEYAEMQDFVAAISEQITDLPDTATLVSISEQAQQLALLVNRKSDPDQVAALSSNLHQQLVSSYDIVVVPRKTPDLERGQLLYSQHCTSCHGASGDGTGALAETMEPSPTNFLDRARFRERTLYGLYSTISQGVEGTGMAAYSEFSEHERWSLAFYVGQLALESTEVDTGSALWSANQSRKISSIEQLTTTSPAQALQSLGLTGQQTLAFLRRHPAALFEGGKQSPLVFSTAQLEASRAAYEADNRDGAYNLAVNAYLEGFELVENSLDAVDSNLRREIEAAMTNYRNLIRKGKSQAEVNAASLEITALLSDAQFKLKETRLSGETAFLSALMILLREGLEAILVIAALAAFLSKTGRREGTVYLYGGVVAALLMGGITWLVSTTLIEIGGASREMTEGIAAITAALVLFYVGFWLHNKTSARQWQHFIESSIKKALSKGTLWGLAGLSFIAVYREVFETVLFYQALWIQTDGAGQDMIFYGLLTGSAVLLVLAWLIMRFSTRLPLRQFFAVSGAFMFMLAIIFTGKGIAALQEAGKIPLDPVALPSIELLGIYPNYQGLIAQGILLILAGVLIFRDSDKHSV